MTTLKIRMKNNDIKYGLSKEEEVRLLLKKIFIDDEDIINTKDLYNNKYCKYDYEGLTTKRKYEVKSRTNTKYAFNTTIIPLHKITPETTNTELIFIFNFIDVCCYIKYDETLFKTFNKKNLKIWRDNKYDKMAEHYEIPINLLIDCIK